MATGDADGKLLILQNIIYFCHHFHCELDIAPSTLKATFYFEASSLPYFAVVKSSINSY